MADWWEFFAALLVFLLSHAIPVRPPVRPWLVARLGLRGYFAAYSLLSIAVLAWLIVAAGRAPYVQVIPPWPLLRWVPLIVMYPVCVLIVGGMWRRNPLSFGGIGPGAFDPQAPGLLATTRHPLLTALMLWSLAHLLANGDLAHVVLFGLFAGFAAMGMGLIDRRKRRDLGDEAWRNLSHSTSRLTWRWRVSAQETGLFLALGGVVYLLLLGAHPAVIGVSPLP